MSRQPDYNRAATAACRVLVHLQVDSLPVRPLAILRRCRNTCLYTFEQAGDMLDMTVDDVARLCGDADACTFRSEEEGQMRYVVCYRTGGNPARLNFTLAHELGHIVLRHRASGAAEEAEADCFASHLLCPDAVLRSAAERGAQWLAHQCYISRTAAEMAMKRTVRDVDAAIQHQIQALLKLEEANK
ncbi:MAG: ImmA/IrrE family metallo-endopeptidase [Aristaeellaceae bacterium]